MIGNKNKTCAKCGDPIPVRRKFCSDSCKWWFNAIKKDSEKGLAPYKKRNKDWCFVYTSVGNSISERGQGRRSGGMVKGSMSANVSYEKVTLMPFNFENMKRHFEKKMGYPYIPAYIRLGDETRMSKEEAETYLINQDTAMAAAHA